MILLRRAAAAALLASLAACGGTGSPDGSVPSAVRGTVLVSAAGSLTDAFAAIEAAFERDHPGVDVRLNLAGSSTLRQQIFEGAPADVFASADQSNMDQVASAGGVAGDSRVFARNSLQIAVPAGNPAGVTGLGDFADDGLLIGLCAPAVPCGDMARQALAAAGVAPSLDTNEPDVRALLTKIELGELDAGITFVTDVIAADGMVEGVVIPAQFDVATAYPIAVLTGAPNPVAAEAFLEFVLGAEGRAILSGLGFGLP